ncbi:MAG: hypothetical protein ACRD2L_15245 [Terriglobia bacterium]
MAAITRLSLDGYGARRAGSFAGKGAAVEEAPAPEAAAQRARFKPGYIAPKRKKKRVEPAVVEIAVETHEGQKEVKYVSLRPSVIEPSVAPIMEAVEDLTRLIESRARNAEIQRKIDELEEEEDIIIIMSALQ